jgi:hypothetical protein
MRFLCKEKLEKLPGKLEIKPTDSVSAQGREGRGFDSACETNFLLFKNDLNLSA